MPDVFHLRVFGSTCLCSHTKAAKGVGNSSLSVQEGIFLGYDGNGPNYKVLFDTKIEVVCREHAKFSEAYCEKL